MIYIGLFLLSAFKSTLREVLYFQKRYLYFYIRRVIVRKIKFILPVICGIIVISLSSCRTLEDKQAVYVPEPSIGSNSTILDSILIERIVNAQPKSETLPFNPNDDPWILIPLCFYSSQKVDPIVKRNYFQNDLDEALQRLFIKDLRASNISKTVINACKINTTEGELLKNYRLELVLKHAVWNRNLTAYGLSYPGTLLWSVGFPTSYGSVKLEVDATLYPPGSAQKPLGTITLSEDESCVEFIYDQLGYQPSVAEDLLTEMFPKIAKNLRKFIKKTIKKQ
jgi:hypothetical protein